MIELAKASLAELSAPPQFPREDAIAVRLGGINRKKPRPPCSLAEFVWESWNVINPQTPLEWNWHHTVLCEHVQAQLELGKFGRPWAQNVVYNVPPGTTKSTIISVGANSWMWTWNPAYRFLCLSGNPDVALRDAIYTRRIIESEWYQRTFKIGWELQDDQDAKGNFANTATGVRQSKGIRAKIIGDKPNCVSIDDPNDPKELDGEIFEGINEDYDNSIGGRVADPRTGLRMIIQQRVADNDLTAHVLELGDYEHVKIEQERELQEDCKCPTHDRGHTFMGYADPRKVEGELLWPSRFTPEVLAGEKKRLKARGYAGQHQQRPAPASGNMFDPLKWKMLPTKPAWALIKAIVSGWDLAATEKETSAFTVRVLIAELKDGSFVIIDVMRKRVGPESVKPLVVETAKTDRSFYGRKIPVRGPQDPGSAGVVQGNDLTKALAGYDAEFNSVTGSKAVRATPLASQQSTGNVFLVEGEWNDDFKEEAKGFPFGKFKDQVDAAAEGFNYLTGDEESSLEHTRKLLNLGRKS